MGSPNMGAALARLLQRAVPALKEQHVGVLTTELTAAQILIDQLRWDAETKQKIIVIGLGVGAAALIWLYLRDRQDNEVDIEEDNLLDMRVEIDVPDTLECIICMEGMKEVMMEPCGHVCCCRNCALSMRTGNRLKCPVCRAPADF